MDKAASGTTPQTSDGSDHAAPGHLGARIIAASLVSSTLGIIPVFMLGALAPLITVETGLTESRLGLAASAFFGMAALLSIPSARVAERIGGLSLMKLSAAASSATLLGLALAGHLWKYLLALLVVAGAANATAQAAGNVAVPQYVGHTRQGLSFGVRLAAVPLATLLSGLAVPSLALTIGWRWALASSAGLAVLYLLLAPDSGRVPLPATANERKLRHLSAPLALLTLAAALGSASGNALSAFYTLSAVHHGLAAGAGGMLLAIGSAVGIVARVFWGWMGDRHPSRAPTILTTLFAVGGIGVILLTQPQLPVLVIATMLSFGAGWAWAGLFLFAVVRDSAHTAGDALGAVLTGVWIGGIAGPTVFGAVAEHVSFTAAWIGAGGVQFLAAACTALSHVLATRQNTATAN